MASGRTVVATGGTGALGRAVVDAFLALGDRVVVPWILKEERDEALSRWRRELDAGLAVLVEADLAEDVDARELARVAGAAEVLVNGIGGFAGGDAFVDTPLELWDRMYRMNVRTAVAATRALLPAMLAARRGVVINVASQAARNRPPTIAAYAASKAAIVVLTESLQKEVANAGIRVCAVAPDTIDTPANRRAMPEADFSRWTPPERIAQTIAWLASDAASTVRGAIVPV
jgi:NAD(P)-dependent dehydrogenase (short-subunit alcohol dehydrogenase family)